ncbi:hypothetical protein ACP70R_025515 [Stipagrostis hirtigluma subsp. patula]
MEMEREDAGTVVANGSASVLERHPERGDGEAPSSGGDGEMGVATRPKAVGEMLVAVTGAAGTEEGKAKAPVVKKTKLVRVKQGFIDSLLAWPRKPFIGVPAESIDTLPPKLRESFHATMATTVALMKKIRDEEEDILEQYRTKGFAMQEVEISDDEDVEVEA